MWRFMEGVQNPNKKMKVDVDKHQCDSEYDRRSKENDKDKQLHDVVQKYSSGKISREQYTHTVL